MTDARVFGKLLFTITDQGGAAPFLDYCRTETPDGRIFWGRLLLLTPWRRNQYGESLPQRGLVIAWEGRTPVWWADWRPKNYKDLPQALERIAVFAIYALVVLTLGWTWINA